MTQNHPMKAAFQRATKLDGVNYDIRGMVAQEAQRLEAVGHSILPLHIGNPAAFDFYASDAMIAQVIQQLPHSQGYCDSKGLLSAREAIVAKYHQEGVCQATPEAVYIGNGVSELILMAMQALLDGGDEMLIPAPDYPLWTAATRLSGGQAVHYRCDDQADWFPDLEDIKKKITPRTRGLLLINPNNPTGAVYSKALLKEVIDLCRQHQIILFSDEIYDKIVYDDAKHIPCASLADDVVMVTFNGLSKSYRAAGFRIGWMMITGPLHQAKSYLQGIDILASMRLCGNVPCQHAIQTALAGYQSIEDYTLPTGRLSQQRDLVYNKLMQIEGVSCIKPKGALYAFAKLDLKKFNLYSDEQLVLDFLQKDKVLLVQGSAFHWPEPNHVRIVFLPEKSTLDRAMNLFGQFLSQYKQIK
jgi:alanine-synthesizing transaminase